MNIRQSGSVNHSELQRFGARRESGMSLIEVLIALAVLSIGLVGMAAMQLNSLQFVHSAHYRSMASAIALDFEERLWIEIADNTLTGCPSSTTGEGTPITDLLTTWSRSAGIETYGSDAAPRLLNIPGMTISVGTVVEQTTDSPVVLIPLTFGWTESRFSDDESTSESYTYNVRVLCRPAA